MKYTRQTAVEAIAKHGTISTGMLDSLGLSFDLWLRFCQSDRAYKKLVEAYTAEHDGGQRVLTEMESRGGRS